MTQEFLQASAESLARLHTKEAIGAIVEVLRDRTAFPGDRIKAAQLLLDRGHGKPTNVTVAIPAKRAVQAQLIGMSDEQLMAIVSARQRSAPTEDSQTVQSNLPVRFHGSAIVEGEIETEEETMARRFRESGLVDDDDPTR